MKKQILLLLITLTTKIVSGQICDGQQVVLSQDGICNYNTYVLVFEDNFDGNTLNLTKWTPINGVVRDENHSIEQQWYSPNNIEVSNGTLKLITKKETLTNQCFDIWIPNVGLQNFCQDFNYISSEIDSKYQFGHGKYEIRCKLPKGKGFFPAFWTYGGSRWNEIDVFEFWNEETLGSYDPTKLSRVHKMNAHYDFDGDGNSENCPTKYTGVDYSQAFHIFTIIWTPYKIEWYVDGDLKRRSTLYYTMLGQTVDCNGLNSFQQYVMNKAFPRESMNIIANLAIQSGNNSPDVNTPFPSALEIDYIRYYTNEPCPASGTVSSTLPCQNNLEQNGFYINNKLDLVTEVCPQNDIIIKAIPLNPTVCPYGYFLLNYKKELFISVTLCNANLVPIDVEYFKWIEPGSATSFNLMNNMPSPYIGFYPDQTYRVKVATNRCGWQEYTKYIHIASDVRNINGSNIVSDVYGKYITISNSTVTQPKEIVARDNIRILPNSNLYAGTYRIDANFGCNDMLGRQTDSTNEEVMRMNYMVDENVSNNEKNIDVEINKKTIAETKLSNTGFSVYPNPNKGKFIIELTNKTTESTIEIYDVMGKKVWSNVSPENKLEIDISNHPKGIYLVKVVSENNVIVQKIIYD